MKYARYGYNVTGHYTFLPLKTVQKTVRLDEHTLDVIMGMPGDKFSDKLRGLVGAYERMTNSNNKMDGGMV